MIKTGKTWKDWTKAEDERLLQGREQEDLSFGELAEQLGRRKYATQTRYYKLRREAALANGAAPGSAAPSPAAEAPGPEMRPENPLCIELLCLEALAELSDLMNRLPPGARRRIIVWLRDWITEEEAGW